MIDRQAASIQGHRLALRMFIPFGLGYFLSYYFRNANAVLAPPIVEQFAINASQIGLTTSLYFFSAMFALVPVALALDRFGPRKTLIVQSFIAGTGCVIFSLGHSVGMLMVGRALIGFGVSGGLITALKAVTVWLPKDQWATGNGLMLGIGSFGAICSTWPLQWMLELVGWRGASATGALGCALVLGYSVLLSPDEPRSTQDRRLSSYSVYSQLLRSRIFWAIVPAASMTLASFFAVQGLWATSWMTDVAHLSSEQISTRLLIMALGWSLGAFVNGKISDFVLSRWGISPQNVMGGGFIVLIASFAFIVFELDVHARWIWAILGFVGNIGSLGYSLISRNFPEEASARAMSALAISNFLFAFLTQWSIGVILDCWDRNPSGNYPGEAYTVAFGAILGAQFIAVTWFFFATTIGHKDELRSGGN